MKASASLSALRASDRHDSSPLNKLRKTILISAAKAGEGHIPSAFSVLDILWVLYDRVLTVDPKRPRSDARDRFIMSKGHASLGLYAVLSEKGFFASSRLSHLAEFDSIFGGHPDRNKVPGVEASTGSLGHGLPIACGVALALRIKKNPARVFTLVGDGESNEGTIWESALLASHHNLSNLCCIVDYNHSNDRALVLGDMQKKFQTFGWESVSIDGHDHAAIYTALQKAGTFEKPLAIIAETIKGKGCKSLEGNPSWHHKCPSTEELDMLIGELEL